MLTHLKRSGSMSACGKSIPYPDYLTDDVESVTCGSCSRKYDGSFNARSVANRKARMSPGYSDPDFKGTGYLKCALCGNPILEHPSWPCSLRYDLER